MQIVIKIGTSLLEVKAEQLIGNLAKELSSLKGKHRFIIVTSGAIKLGMDKLGIRSRPRDLNKLQACAAIGQPMLMDIYSTAFSRHGVNTAQVLLTQDDFNDRVRYLNMRNALLELVEMCAIPIVNENDTVSVHELEGIFSDNDELAALLAIGMNAEALVLLSSVDGLMRDGKQGSDIISELSDIDETIFSLANGKSSSGTGGMLSKLRAAKKASLAGVKVIITNGRKKNCVQEALEGKAGTLIKPRCRVTGKKKWIAFGTREKGELLLNKCAADAIKKGASLLAVGIVECKGSFNKGDVVKIIDANGHVIAKGISNYSSAEITAIKGRNSSEIEKLMGYAYGSVLYRDNMVFSSDLQ